MNRLLLVAALATTTALAAPAHAVDTYSDLSTWQGAVSSYARDTSYGANLSDIGNVALDGGAEITFGAPVNIRTIGDGWGTWSGGYTGQVLFSNGATSVSGTFTNPVGAFGFFSEPDPFSVHSFTLSLSDGSSISGDFNGSAGAGFLGWVGDNITGFTISSDVSFAFGDFYTGVSAIPEPATWLTMIAGFGLIGLAMRRRNAALATA